MNNCERADVFTLIADLSEIKGEIIYKTLAYRNATENLTGLRRDANEYWKEGKHKEIPGVGKVSRAFLNHSSIFSNISRCMPVNRLKSL